jgi:hypothetical protein
VSSLIVHLKRSTLPVLAVLCLAALTASYAYADGALRPLATQVIGDPDAAVAGKFAVGTATPGNKALTVVGVIDFLGSGTVHNYFTQGTGNNMQINTNVDEANTVVDATKSQWKLVMGSSLDWFSIRRSPAGATYNEDALFFIEGSTGRVGIATVDTGNGASIPFTPQARLHVQTASGNAIEGVTAETSGDPAAVYGWASGTDGYTAGVHGRSDSNWGSGLVGQALSTYGFTYGVEGRSESTDGCGVHGYVPRSTGFTMGVRGDSDSSGGVGVFGHARASTGATFGVWGESDSTNGRGVYGFAYAHSGVNYGVYGQSDSTDGSGVYGEAAATSGTNYGVYGRSESPSGYGLFGEASATSGNGQGVHALSASPSGVGVYGLAWATTGSNVGVIGQSSSASGTGVYGVASATTGTNFGVYGQSYSSSGYGVFYQGGLAGTGTKSAIVETEAYGWRSLYAVESPQNWFEDFGRATLAGGEAMVSIEPVFAQTVNLGKDYHVFLTPLGSGCTLYVVDMSSTSFTVRANEGTDCDVAFDYRIIAPRLDYEDLRLKEAENPEAVAASMPEVK